MTWLTASQIARAIGCSQQTARLYLRPYHARSVMQGRARTYPPHVLAALLAAASTDPWRGPGELSVTVAAAHLGITPYQVRTLLTAHALTPVPRRHQGRRATAHLTPEQLQTLAGALGVRRELERTVETSTEAARARKATREAVSDMRRAGWLNLRQIAQRWQLSADAALLRLMPEMDRAEHVPVVAGEPRELWFPPECIMRVAGGQQRQGGATV